MIRLSPLARTSLPAVRLPRAALVASLAALSACAAHSKGGDYWSDQAVEQVRPRETEIMDGAELATAQEHGTTLFGVRHDIGLGAASGSQKAACTCIAAAVGDAGDARFRWNDKAPEIGADALVFAMSDKGIECPASKVDESARRPSISAVDRSGADVIIEIEDVPDGRPVASGAVIPKPEAGGSVYVRPRSAKLPYGRSFVLGSARCKVY